MMRFEYADSIKQMISKKVDDASRHGRRVERVWLTLSEWSEFYNSLTMAELGVVAKMCRGQIAPIHRAEWEGVKICVCNNIDEGNR